MVSICGPATVNDQRRPGHQCGRVAGQKHHATHQVLDGAEAAELILDSTLSRHATSRKTVCLRGSTKVGQSVLTPMPCGASSIAMALKNRSIARYDAQYSERWGGNSKPVTLPLGPLRHSRRRPRPLQRIFGNKTKCRPDRRLSLPKQEKIVRTTERNQTYG